MKLKREYKRPNIRKLSLDNQTSMILQSPPHDPPDIDSGFLKLPF